jgi:hypothetical protein
MTTWVWHVVVTGGLLGASVIAVFFPYYFSAQSPSGLLLVVPMDALPSAFPEINRAIHADEYRWALAMACAVAIPMAVDVVLDSGKVPQQSWQERVHWIVRGFLLLAMTMPDLAMIYSFGDGGDDGDDVQTFITVDKFMKIVATATLFCYFAVDHHGAGLGPWCAAVVLLVGLSQCFVVAYHMAAHGANGYYAPALVCEVGAALVGLACAAKWLLQWRRAGRRATADDVCYGMYFLAIAVFVLGHLAVSGHYGNGTEFNYGDTSAGCLAAFVYVRVAFLVIVMKVGARTTLCRPPRAIRRCPHLSSPGSLSISRCRAAWRASAASARRRWSRTGRHSSATFRTRSAAP